MGSGIAIVAARAGFRAIFYDLSARSSRLQRAAQTEGFLRSSRSSAENSPHDERDAHPRRVAGTDDGSRRSAQCDIVIEAVFEDLQVKRELLARLDKVCAPHAIFASNTSTLSITEIAAGSGRAGPVCRHAFLPARALMKLVEMSPGLLTERDASQTAWG